MKNHELCGLWMTHNSHQELRLSDFFWSTFKPECRVQIIINSMVTEMIFQQAKLLISHIIWKPWIVGSGWPERTSRALDIVILRSGALFDLYDYGWVANDYKTPKMNLTVCRMLLYLKLIILCEYRALNGLIWTPDDEVRAFLRWSLLIVKFRHQLVLIQ